MVEQVIEAVALRESELDRLLKKVAEFPRYSGAGMKVSLNTRTAKLNGAGVQMSPVRDCLQISGYFSSVSIGNFLHEAKGRYFNRSGIDNLEPGYEDDSLVIEVYDGTNGLQIQATRVPFNREEMRHVAGGQPVALSPEVFNAFFDRLEPYRIRIEGFISDESYSGRELSNRTFRSSSLYGEYYDPSDRDPRAYSQRSYTQPVYVPSFPISRSPQSASSTTEARTKPWNRGKGSGGYGAKAGNSGKRRR